MVDFAKYGAVFLKIGDAILCWSQQFLFALSIVDIFHCVMLFDVLTMHRICENTGFCSILKYFTQYKSLLMTSSVCWSY